MWHLLEAKVFVRISHKDKLQQKRALDQDYRHVENPKQEVQVPVVL